MNKQKMLKMGERGFGIWMGYNVVSLTAKGCAGVVCLQVGQPQLASFLFVLSTANVASLGAGCTLMLGLSVARPLPVRGNKQKLDK